MATVDHIPVAALESKVLIRTSSHTTTEYEGPPVPVVSNAMTIDPNKATGTIGEHAHGHPDLSLTTATSESLDRCFGGRASHAAGASSRVWVSFWAAVAPTCE